MTIDDDITDEIRREGGATATDDASDHGGRTQYGISEKANPEAWLDGKVTEPEARDIYLRKYVIGPGWSRLPATHGKLQAQLIDWTVTTGAFYVTQKLQTILGLPQDGLMGPHTLAAITASDPVKLNNQLAVERIKMLGRLVVKDPSQAKFIVGWLNRATDFII